ncbi:MAG: serine/threonine protein kinase [Polyangiaceae bacterium]|nr:serine/threonine protein kinase [Polyangiaceae bacterium]
MSSDRPPKEVIADRYRLIEQIGRGGMGSVWRAEHTSLKTPVAIKLLNPRLAGDPTLRARFLREAQSAAALTSAHIVRTLDHGVDGDVPYIAMEFLDGESLRGRLRREGRLSPAATAAIFAGVSRGIAKAHRAGIVHRDLKPDNIFLAHDEDHGEVAKVVDFGIAKIVDETKLPDGEGPEGISTATGAMLGTPYYMSPEQLRGKKQIDTRADLWAMAVIAFECLTGKRPFTADAIGELVLTICSDPTPIPSKLAPVPEGFDAWFERAAAVSPDDRFQTIQELARELAAVLGDTKAPWLPTEPDANTSSPRLSIPTPTRSSPFGGAKPSTPPRSGGIATATTAIASDEDLKVQSATGGVHSISTISRAPASSRRGLYVVLGVAAVGAAGAIVAVTQSGPDAASPSAKTAEIIVSSTAVVPTAGLSTAAPDASTAIQIATTSASSTAPSTSIDVTFETTPAGAEIVLDGKRLGAAPGPIAFERGAGEVTVTVRKAGYTAKQVKLTPDASKTLKVELARTKRPSDVLD